MYIKIIYEDEDVLVVDKPARIVVFDESLCETRPHTKSLADYLIEQMPKLADIGSPPRYGIVHRLDKDTSGILLVAKSNESLIFLQKQFINREVEKKYLALVCGTIKEDSGEIKTLIARSPGDKRKQKAYLFNGSSPSSAREAVTNYRVLQRYEEFTLLEVQIKTGRRHQIRCHLAYIHHPIAGDKMYGFKDSPVPEGLARQFLHAEYLRVKLPSGEIKEFHSELSEDLQKVLKNLKLKI